MKPTLVVLAAGLASRYGSLKQIDQFGPSGETITDYSIYDAIRAGFKKVAFIIRRDIEDDFKEVFGKKFGDRIEVDFAFQEIDIVPEGVMVPEERIKPWGTGHAVLMAADQVADPFAVINADDFYGATSFQLLHDHLVGMNTKELNACLIGYKLKNTLSDHGYVSRGICSLTEENNLTKITERTHIYKKSDQSIYFEEDNKKYPLTGEELVSMNLVGFTPPFFDVLRTGFEEFAQSSINTPKSEFFLPTAVSSIINKHASEIPVIETPDLTYGVTYQDDKALVRDMIKKRVEEGVYPENLWSE